MTDKALAIYGQFDQLQRAALAMQKSGFFPDVKSEAQAIVKVMAGAELGLPPFASMTGINIIQGKPVLGANVLATLVKNDPRYDYRLKNDSDTECVLEWYENGKPVGTSAFTIREAQNAGLTSKDNWKKYPSDMLFARAISRGARRFAPGIFGGSPVYTPDEMGVDTDENGFVDAIVKDVTEEAPRPEPENGKPPQPSLVELTLEEAQAVVNSKGVKYGEIATETLSNMANSIQRAMDSGKTKDEHLRKLEAIKLILKARAETA